jgi:hypothetical protein
MDRFLARILKIFDFDTTLSRLKQGGASIRRAAGAVRFPYGNSIGGHQVASKHVQHFLNRSDFRAIFFMPKWVDFRRGF